MILNSLNVSDVHVSLKYMRYLIFIYILNFVFYVLYYENMFVKMKQRDDDNF